MENTKECAKCKEIKAFGQFYKSKRGRNGLSNYCKLCSKACKDKWYQDNKERVKIYNNLDYIREKRENTRRERYRNDPVFRAQENERGRRHYANSKTGKIKRNLQRKKWAAIPKNRIAITLRKRIYAALNGIAATESTETLLGCSFESARLYIESLFQPGMSWENYGDWHIDHIIPLSNFDLMDINQAKIACNHLNLRPLWKLDNFVKGSKLIPDLYCETLAKIKEALCIS
jgi:hypothetical protein